MDFIVFKGILHEVDPDLDLQKKLTSDLKEKWTLFQKSLHELTTHCRQIQGC